MALTLAELVVVALAAYRVTRFVVSDTLIEGTRDRLRSAAFTSDRHGEFYRPVTRPDGQVRPAATMARGKAADLLTCSWCAGWWISTACYTLTVVALGRWGGTPLLVHAVTAAAVAGVQGFIGSRPDA